MSERKRKKPFSLETWIEADLSAQAREGKLLPVFGLDDTIRQVCDVLVAEGDRSPVLVGPAGIGKTAIIHAIVQACADGKGPDCFRGARFVQLSFKGIASHFKEKSDGADTLQEIVDAIRMSSTPIVPFIRDIHRAYDLDWETLVHRLCSSLGRPILAEGSTRELRTMLDFSPELAEWLVPIPLEEPSIARTRQIVAQWTDHQRSRTGRTISPAAQRSAIDLTGRFIGNRHFPRKALDLLREARDLSPDAEPVGLPEVIRRFSATTRVPPPLVDPAIELDLSATRRFVGDRLLGQEEAVDAVVRVVALIKAGLSDPRRPFGVFLFVGPTGVGKTHTAQLLAEYFFGDRSRMLRINLSDFGGEAAHGQLFGVAAGHPEMRRGELARRLGNAPFGVLLLDELEKAHASVHDGLLQLVDEGRYINGNGETVSVRSLIVIATSNAGAEVFRETGVGFAENRDHARLDAELDRRLLQTFRFEFLNRFDRVVHFHPLSRATIRQIAQRELAFLLDREGLKGRELKVEVDADVLDWLVAHGYHPHFGARFLRRELERSLVGPLAAFIVGERVRDGETIAVGVRAGRIDVRRPVAPVLAAPRPEPEPDADVAAAVERWSVLLDTHASRRREAQALLEESGKAGFWSDPSHAHGILSRYRSLDARIAADQRLLGVVDQLKSLAPTSDPDVVRQVLMDAEAARRRWRLLDDGGDDDGAFLLLGPVDATGSVDAEWLAELVAFERAWLKKQGLDPVVVAEEVAGERAIGVVFEVDGSGLAATLAMEAGIHRRRTRSGDADRLLVEVLPRRPASASNAQLSDARRAAGTFVQEVRARLTIELPARGRLRTFRGTDRDTLGLLAAALVAQPDGDHETARQYHFDGVACRDPRTGATVVAVKDLKRGALETLRRAWDLGVDNT